MHIALTGRIVLYLYHQPNASLRFALGWYMQGLQPENTSNLKEERNMDKLKLTHSQIKQNKKLYQL